MTASTTPPPHVVVAFGLSGSPSQMDGGQGQAYLIQGAVLKPVHDAIEAEWIAQLHIDLQPNGFRVARPVATSDGRWVVDGWCAFEEVRGDHRLWDAQWPDAVAVCGRLHAALATVDKPAFLDGRVGPFPLADQVAWGERVIDLPAPIAGPVGVLASLRGPVSAPSQIIHGDLAGNLLYADGLDPAVIDLSPYWRPGGYATAMMVVDAMLWYGASLDLISSAAHVPELEQLLVRALTFRLVLDGILGAGDNGTLRWEASQVAWDLDHAQPLIDWLSSQSRHLARIERARP